MWSLFRALRKPQLSALRFLAEKSVGSPSPSWVHYGQRPASTQVRGAMKRRDFICGAGLAALSLLVGCSGDSQSNQDATSGRLPALAVIETRPHVAPSRIHWLDSDLEALGSTEINHAAVGDYSRPAVMDGKLLLAPTGPTGRNDDKTVLSIELDDFRVTEYALDAVNNYCIAAAGGHAFVGGNLNFQLPYQQGQACQWRRSVLGPPQVDT